MTCVFVGATLLWHLQKWWHTFAATKSTNQLCSDKSKFCSSKINYAAAKWRLERQNQFRNDRTNSHQRKINFAAATRWTLQRHIQLCSSKIDSAATNPLLVFVVTNICRRRRGDLKLWSDSCKHDEPFCFPQSQFLLPPTLLPFFSQLAKVK